MLWELYANGCCPECVCLAKFAPDFAPYNELLGHFEKRAGNLLLAKTEFEKAVALYEAYLTDNKLTYFDCPNLVRAQLSLASVLKSLGDFEGALVIAHQLNKLPIDMQRLYSPGTTLVLWEGKTLGARLCLARGLKGDFQAGTRAVA